MSDISQSSSTRSYKRRIHEIDDTIEHLTHEIKKLDDFVSKSEFQCSLMSLKLKRERIKALTAIAKSKVILADMEVLVAESDLFLELETLKNCKKTKLSRCEGESTLQNIAQNIPASATKSVSVQTATVEKKKRKNSSSKKSTIDISSDETVLVPTIEEHNRSLAASSQSSISLGLLNIASANSSDSEVSLSSSIKAEFSNPYTNTDPQVPEKQTQVKKNKSDKKVSSKSKSTNVTQETKTQTIKTKTVAEINRSICSTTPNNTINNSCGVSTPTSRPLSSLSSVKNSTASTPTYAPIRHNNLPMIFTLAPNVCAPMPSTSTMRPCLYVSNPVPQASVYQSPRMGNTNQSYTFYGNKQ